MRSRAAAMLDDIEGDAKGGYAQAVALLAAMETVVDTHMDRITADFLQAETDVQRAIVAESLIRRLQTYQLGMLANG